MNQDTYDAILHDFRHAYATAHGLIQHLVGRPTGSRQLYYVEAGFKTMVLFSSSLLQAVPGGQGLAAPDAWNLPAASSAARGIIEAYRSLSYVAFHEVSDDERAFRIAVMGLHDLDRRMKVLKRLGPYGTALPQIEQYADALRAAVVANPLFAGQSLKAREKITGKDAPDFLIGPEVLDTASGINTDLRMIAQVFLSQFVHTHPMGLHSMYHFTPDSGEARRLMSLPMQYSQGYLVKASAQVAAFFDVAINYKDRELQLRHGHSVDVIERGLTSAEDASTLTGDLSAQVPHGQ